MKIAIMQPYFLPYIGYFQLINTVDIFVIYDNIEYTKKGWINRNRILVEGKDEYITLPLKKDSDFKHVQDRNLAESWNKESSKLRSKIYESYRKAPYFGNAFPIIDKCISFEATNLFEFILHSVQQINQYLEISTPIIKSSSLEINHNLKSEEKVIAICKALNSKTYINPIGGLKLYRNESFVNHQIELNFLKSNDFIYEQYSKDNFISWLSIIDVMMFNDKDVITHYINKEYKLITNHEF